MIRPPRASRVLVAGLVVVGIAVGGFLAWSSSRDRDLAGIDWAHVDVHLGPVVRCPADHLRPCHDQPGSGTRVLVVGDSQTQMLVATLRRLAAQHDWDLWLNEQPGCPWQTGLVNEKLTAAAQEHCVESRGAWYTSALPRIRPDVVVMLARPRDDPSVWKGLIERQGRPDQPIPRAVRQTTRATLATVAPLVPRVLVVQRLLMPETFKPNDCLATASSVEECAVAPPTHPSRTDSYVADAAAGDPKITAVDLNPAFCVGFPRCEPVVDGQPVFYDDHHYASEYARTRSAQVWRILDATGAFRASP